MKKLLLILLGLTILNSAHADRGSANEGASKKDGVGSGGGGNSINGKPIEFYKKDITQMPEYQNLIRPTFDRVVSQVVSLAHYLKETATQKHWYFVPVALEKLPSAQIGVVFPTEQMARQSMTEIYVDQKLFEAQEMTEKARVTLLTHEMVMGAILSFNEQAIRVCRGQSEATDCKKFLRRRGVDSPSLLVEKDYEIIRGLTAVIVEMIYNPELDLPRDDQVLLRTKLFGEIIKHGLEDSFPEQVDFRKIKKFFANLFEVYQILQSKKLDHSIPSFTGFGSGHVAGAVCQWQFDYKEDQFFVERTTVSTNGNGIRSKINLVFNSKHFESIGAVGGGTQTQLTVASTGPAPVLGSQRSDLILHYDQTFIKWIEIREYVYVFNEFDKTYYWNEIKDWDENGHLSRENSCYYDSKW